MRENSNSRVILHALQGLRDWRESRQVKGSLEEVWRGHIIAILNIGGNLSYDIDEFSGLRKGAEDFLKDYIQKSDQQMQEKFKSFFRAIQKEERGLLREYGTLSMP